MDNQVTDQLRLVEEIIFKTLPFLSHTLPTLQNVSQEIFRDGKHIGAVSPYNQGSSLIKVRNGDVIYRVKLLPQTYSIAGTLTTRDNYVRIYEIALELQVNDSYSLVQHYLKQMDPVNLAVTRFKTVFQQHTAQLEHDKVRNPVLLLDRWNNFFSDLGIKITQIYKFTLRDDPKRSEELAIHQDTKVKGISIRAQADLRLLEDRLVRNLKTDKKNMSDKNELNRISLIVKRLLTSKCMNCI